MSYIHDIQQLRQRFKKVDTKDPTSIQQWFAEHPYLTTNDHAQIAQKSLFWIRKIKRFASIKNKTPPVLPISKPRRSVNTLVAPVQWDDPEWLRETAKHHNVLAMSRACGISRAYMRKKLAKYGIPPMSERAYDPRSDKYNYQWVYEHYVIKGMSQKQCAKLAGIARQTFAIWLNRLKIPVRGSLETSSQQLEVKLWIRKLINKLEQLETIRKIFIREDHIHIRFKNYYWESYYIEKYVQIPRSFTIFEQDAILEKVPIVRFQYESNMDQDYYPAHIYISRQEWKKASFIERRIALHDFARVIARRGWIKHTYPLEVLHREKMILYNYKQSNHIFENALTSCPRSSVPYPGLKTILHFVDMSYIWQILKSPKLVMKMLNTLSLKAIEINTYNMIRLIHEAKYVRFKIYDPRVYVALFQKIGKIKSVLDLHPGNGYLAIACAIAKIKYYIPEGHKVAQALSEGMAEHFGLEWQYYDGQQKVDCTISCDDFQFTNIVDTLNYRDRSNIIIQFVPNDLKDQIMRLYEPSNIISVKTNIYEMVNFDYFFIFNCACQI